MKIKLIKLNGMSKVSKLKKVRLGKKALIFTIASFLLLSSVFILNLVYLERSKELQSQILNSDIASKLRYAEDDISSNIYSEFLPINISSISLVSGIKVINFSETIYFGTGINYVSRFNDYKSVIENKYANLNNLDISLNNFSSNFTILPYNSVFVLNSNNITMSNNSSFIKSYDLLLKVNESAISSTDFTSGSGSVSVHVVLLNVSNSVLYDSTTLTSPSQLFRLGFNFPSGKLLRVRFGNFDSLPYGSFDVSSNFYAELRSLGIGFSASSQPIKIVGGKIRLHDDISSITKEVSIELLEE